MKVGVVHPNLNLKGGAEYVSLQIIKSLQEDGYEVELITLNDPCWKVLKDFYSMELGEVIVRKPVLVSKVFGDTRSFFKLRSGLVKRFARKNSEDYDLLVSTLNEADLGGKGVQYVHFPEAVSEASYHGAGKESTGVKAVYDNLVSGLKGVREGVESNLTFVNSEYTKSAYNSFYSNEAQVLNPPVGKIRGESFEDRKNSFVVIGALKPHKRQKEIVEVIEKVRTNGFMVELDFVGSKDSSYGKKVEDLVEDKDFVNLHGEVSREELEEIVGSCKFGIHGFSGEHFGLAPAEMINAGCIVFVPDKGGPAGFVNRGELVFTDKEDAVKKISNVLRHEDLQKEIRNDLDEISFPDEKEFRQRFIEEVNDFIQ